MTQQDIFKKWMVYGLVLVMTAGLQQQVFGRLRLFGAAPVLLPLAVMALASLEGAADGAGFGMGAGMIAIYLDGSSAWVVLLLCLCGIITGLLAQHSLSRSFLGYLLCCLGAMILREGWCVLIRWYQDVAPLRVLLRVAGPEFLYTMLLSPLVYLMFRFVYRRWGTGYYL